MNKSIGKTKLLPIRSCWRCKHLSRNGKHDKQYFCKFDEQRYILLKESQIYDGDIPSWCELEDAKG